MASNTYINVHSREAGLFFERWVERSCDYYYQKGIASIEKTPEPIHILEPIGERSNGRFMACYAKQAQPDFKGCLCDGSCVLFDTKHTDKDEIAQTAVTQSQRETFERYEKMGAHCFIVASLHLENFYRIPWNVWSGMQARFGHKKMTREELEDYRVPMQNGNILFLQGIELRQTIDTKEEKSGE